MIYRLDHVAFAVEDLKTSSRIWTDLMGGRHVQGVEDWHGFGFVQFGWPSGGRVELISPASDRTGFVRRFLDRHGEGFHHMTFLSDDLRSDVARIRELGQEVFDENYDDPTWMEAFAMLPLQGRRVLVQIAQSSLSTDEQDAAWGSRPLESVIEAVERFR
jgi:methylmalonyl-CoA/ethylmalonyl-CoA epimerase